MSFQENVKNVFFILKNVKFVFPNTGDASFGGAKQFDYLYLYLPLSAALAEVCGPVTKRPVCLLSEYLFSIVTVTKLIINYLIFVVI